LPTFTQYKAPQFQVIKKQVDELLGVTNYHRNLPADISEVLAKFQ